MQRFLCTVMHVAIWFLLTVVICWAIGWSFRQRFITQDMYHACGCECRDAGHDVGKPKVAGFPIPSFQGCICADTYIAE